MTCAPSPHLRGEAAALVGIARVRALSLVEGHETGCGSSLEGPHAGSRRRKSHVVSAAGGY